MQVIEYPLQKDWRELLKRPSQNFEGVKEKVRSIIDDVKQSGDKALKKYSKRFDGVDINDFTVDENEWKAAETIGNDLKIAIKTSVKNITAFHQSQKEEIKKIETMPGILCWRKCVAVEKVGLYIPGGTAPLFSTLIMLAVPAMLAGCKKIVVCTPSQKDGLIHPAILYVAKQTGINKIYKLGGAQAVAAMAYGTETIDKVYKIFGPGNQYITYAKMLLSAEGIAIDIPAGPSEVAVLADAAADPKFVAADLLSQAEHGKDSQVILVTNDKAIINETKKNIEQQLNNLSRKEIVKAALKNSKFILARSLDEGIDMLNEYAPEHLIIACKDAEQLAEKVINAGSVFIGNYASESAGDYASGTNHTLPTNGFAKAYSGVSLDSFYKKITFQQLTKEGLNNIASTVQIMANAEGLQAHANAVQKRLNN